MKLLQKHLAGLIYDTRSKSIGDQAISSPAHLSLLQPNSANPIRTLSLSNHSISTTPLSILLRPLDPPPSQPIYSTVEQLDQTVTLVSQSHCSNLPLSSSNWLNLFLESKPISPSEHPPSLFKEDQLVMKIPSIMIEPNKNSFANATIGRFFGKRPTVEWLTQQANNTY